MIRLIPLGEAVQKGESISEPCSPTKSNSRRASEIRLGQRRRRTTTLTEQAASQICKEAAQRPTEQPARQFCIGQRLTPVVVDGRMAKIRMHHLETSAEGSFCFIPEGSGAGSPNGPAGGEKQGRERETYSGRQIVKLKHRKRRPFSPIDKLAPLLGQSPLLEPAVNM